MKELCPGADAGVTPEEIHERFYANANAVRIVVRDRESGEVRDGLVNTVRPMCQHLVTWIWSVADGSRRQVWWEEVDVLAFARDPFGPEAFRWACRIWVFTTGGWRAVELEAGDPPQLGDVVLRQLEVAFARGRRPAGWVPSPGLLESAVASISGRYAVVDVDVDAKEEAA